jgi:phenylalanyl-tRNA synthetase beta chain
MTYTLTNPERNFGLVRTEGRAVEVANPVSEEHTILRTSLIPSLLGVLRENRRNPLPQMIFEVGDVVLLDEDAETGARDERRVCGMIIGEGFGFTGIRSRAEALLREMGIKFEVRPIRHPSFIEGRCGEIVVDGASAGIVGEIHPEVILGFELQHPVSAFEVKLGSWKKKDR